MIQSLYRALDAHLVEGQAAPCPVSDIFVYGLCCADVLKVRLQLQAASFSSKGKQRSGGQARGLVCLSLPAQF